MDIATRTLEASYAGTDYSSFGVNTDWTSDVQIHGCACSIVEARMAVRALARSGQAGALLDRAGLALELDGSTLSPALRLDRPGDSESIYALGAEVTLPAATPLAVDGDSHNVVVDGMTSAVRVTLSSGDVRVATTGDADVGTSSGNLTVTAGGNLTSTSSSGDRTLSAGGYLDDQGSSGKVIARAPAGTILNSSGDVELFWTPGDGHRMSIYVSSGDVRVTVPASAGFTYRVTTGSGDIDVDGDRGSSETREGTIPGDGNSSARLEIEASSGNVVVIRGRGP